MRQVIAPISLFGACSLALSAAGKPAPEVAGTGAPLAAPIIRSTDQADRRTFEANDIFNLEFAVDPQISPDGKSIVYVRRSMDKHRDLINGDLWVVDVASGIQRSLAEGPGIYSTPRWSPSGDRLVYKRSDEQTSELRVLYINSGKDFPLSPLTSAPGAASWSPDGETIAFSMFVQAEPLSLAEAPQAPAGARWAKPVLVFDELVVRVNGSGYAKKGATQVFVVAAAGGTPRQVTTGDTGFSAPAWLNNNRLLVVGNDADDAELDPIESEIYTVDLETTRRRALTDRNGPDTGAVVSPDGKKIAYIGYDDKLNLYQEADLYVMNIDGSGVRNLTADYDRSIGLGLWHPGEPIRWHPNGSALIAMVEDEGALSLVSIPLTGVPTTLVSDVGGISVGRPNGRGQFSVAAKVNEGSPLIAYTLARPDRPADIAVLSGSGISRRLTTINEDALGHIDLAAIKEIKVASSFDGLEIEAWIALPPGFKRDGSYPMILEIHGGPDSMYGPYFAAEIQHYAARGYVVVYANPRGSTGYGEAFVQYIERAFPGNDYDDLMSVVDYVVNNNYVDPRRLFVTGGSGGGLLTAWIVGKTHRFAAAATVKPTINRVSAALTSDISAFKRRNWHRVAPWENLDYYWKHSPLSLVGNVRTPTLVMVGEKDWRTWLSEALQFYTALKLRKVDSAFVVVPDASHNLAARPSNLIAKADNITAWFKKFDVNRETGE